ncbi:recombinase family protein [Aestuariivirga litoralis]|uniref:Recombinase family protein n=1 Tax=Aestuariivirga litoralis TaxID=2650924 RepID=A0A2W2CBA8_9HYPH|nr:recombinase family protein [Aestuariivirga litoralis]PZF77473.1 recombinase family protein [Aestuariivirga litoralis]
MSKTHAYSYQRFSTPEQSKGDSLRRQYSLAVDYAARNGLNLQDVSYQDLGVSAYRGANAETGHLAEFIDAVKLGVIPRGSFLLIESLDRLSRAKPRQAVRLLERICEMDITVVTLNDGKRYTIQDIDEDPISFMVAFMVAVRAHEESLTKGRRVRAAWSNKRAKAREMKLTKRCPSWLRLNEDRKSFEIIDDKAQIVRRIYEMTAQGMGQNQVVKVLNRENVTTLNDAAHWHKSTVAKLLRSDAPIGTYVPHLIEHVNGKRIRRPQEPVENYYPAIVSQKLWQEVRLATAKGAAIRGRAAGSGDLQNVLSGLCKCDLCDGPMVYIKKSDKDRYLICQRAKNSAGCQYRAVRYQPVEDVIVAHLNPFAQLERFASDDRLGSELAKVEAEITGIADMLDNLRETKSSTLRTTLAELDIALVDAETRRDQIQRKIEEQEPALMMARIDLLGDALTEQPLDRPKVNRLLRQLLEKVILRQNTGELEFHWKNGGRTEVMFRWPEEE